MTDVVMVQAIANIGIGAVMSFYLIAKFRSTLDELKDTVQELKMSVQDLTKSLQDRIK